MKCRLEPATNMGCGSDADYRRSMLDANISRPLSANSLLLDTSFILYDFILDNFLLDNFMNFQLYDFCSLSTKNIDISSTQIF